MQSSKLFSPGFCHRYILFAISSLGAILSPSSGDCAHESPYKIAVIGTGYVGLVAGACIAEFGHQVTCVDIEQSKIDLLNQGIIPIYEEGLEDLVERNRGLERLFFTSELRRAIQENDVIFICVGTPSQKTGQADLAAIESAAQMIGKNLNGYKTIFIKSSIPLGAGKQIWDLIQQTNDKHHPFDLAYAPEFLREGISIQDFLQPDRIVLGSDSARAQKVFLDILQPLSEKDVPFLFTSIESAEVIKYAANSFLAVKASFANELAKVCDATGADIVEVTEGIGTDTRIGPDFLKPGPGIGGSCLPKDMLAFLHAAKQHNLDLKIVSAAIEVNQAQPFQILAKLDQLLGGSFQGKTLAILGLAFKENTDDVRESPAVKIIEQLLAFGACIKAYDPLAATNMKKIYPQIEYCDSFQEAAQDANGAIFLTAWKSFSEEDLSELRILMKNPIILDARNCVDPALLKRYQFTYDNLGRTRL